jgi:hypothetical protein
VWFVACGISRNTSVNPATGSNPYRHAMTKRLLKLIDGMRASGRSEQRSKKASTHEKTFEFFIVFKRGIGPTVASSQCSRPSP